MLRRRSASHRRRGQQEARRRSRAVPRAGRAAAEIRLPRLRGRGRPGASPGARDRRRSANRGAGRPRTGLQIRRSPAALSSGADLRAAGPSSRPLDARRLGRPGGVSSAADPRAAFSPIFGLRRSCSPTRPRRPVLDSGRGRPRPGSFGPTRETTVRGAARTRLRSPTSMRPIGRRRSRSRTLPGSRAFSRSMAMPATVRWPRGATSVSPSAGRMCAAASMTEPSPKPRRSPMRRCNASRNSMPSRRTFAGVRPTSAAPFGTKRSHPIVAELEPWLRAKLALISKKSKLAEAIRYALARREGLCRFLDDGRIEIDSNTVERSIRPLALNRKNALFAGSDGGGDNWAVIATLIENCKLNGVEPHAYITDLLTKIVNGHRNSAIEELLPLGIRNHRATQSCGVKTTLTDRLADRECRRRRISNGRASPLQPCGHAINPHSVRRAAQKGTFLRCVDTAKVMPCQTLRFAIRSLRLAPSGGLRPGARTLP